MEFGFYRILYLVAIRVKFYFIFIKLEQSYESKVKEFSYISTHESKVSYCLFLKLNNCTFRNTNVFCI